MLRKLSVAVVLAAVVLVSSAVWADNPNPGVLPPSSHAFGTTYSDLAGAWWNWALQSPEEENPILDDTGEDGARGQSGKVWFLAGTFGGSAERTLTVPAGKALFFPLVNSVFWVPDDGPNEAAVRALAAADIDATTVLECTVDGVALNGLFFYRAASPEGGFVLHIPEGSILHQWGYNFGDRYPAVADGYWLLLAPLSAGKHEISFHAVRGDPEDPVFELEVTYHITIGPVP
jgi:hypothetical protein